MNKAWKKFRIYFWCKVGMKYRCEAAVVALVVYSYSLSGLFFAWQIYFISRLRTTLLSTQSLSVVFPAALHTSHLSQHPRWPLWLKTQAPGSSGKTVQWIFVVNTSSHLCLFFSVVFYHLSVLDIWSVCSSDWPHSELSYQIKFSVICIWETAEMLKVDCWKLLCFNYTAKLFWYWRLRYNPNVWRCLIVG